MLDKKVLDVQILHVGPLTSIADYLVVGSAESDRQTRAVADHNDGILTEKGDRPISIEGTASGQWVLMDFGDVVAHIFRQDAREHYALERLWSDAKPLEIPEDKPEEPVVAPKRRIVVRATKAKKSA